MFRIVEEKCSDIKVWDDFVDHAVNGTIFHLMSFLSYHGNRFQDRERHLAIFDDNSRFAQVSLSIDDFNGERIARSPYGASYGGFVFNKVPSYRDGGDLLNVFIDYLLSQDLSRFVITSPLACCSEYSMDTFYFNLLEKGFRSVNRDISSVFPLKTGSSIDSMVSTRARRMERKAINAGIAIGKRADIKNFWKVMDSTFEKHGTSPTHTLEEFRLLTELLPERVYVDVAYKDEVPIAGIGYLVINNRVNSSFYLCQDPDYQKYQGLSYLIMEALRNCQDNGFCYFDFGTSSFNMIARENIFSFKENFTKSGMFRETFEWIKA